MRFREFTPILIEFALAKGEDPFKKLADIADETSVDDPLHKEALEIMNIILDKIKTDTPAAPAAVPAAVPPAAPAAPAAPPAANPNSVISEKHNIEMPDDLIWEEYLNSIENPSMRNKMAKDPKIKSITLNFIKKYEEKKTEALKGVTDLASKVLQRISKSTPSESEVEALIGIFRQNQIPDERMKYFLSGAINGKVINMLSLVKTSSGKIDDHVSSSYKNIFSKVVNDFFNLADGMRTAGNIGPGEVAFVLLGDPTKKMNKGDLEVGNESFEVKASNVTPKFKKDGTPATPAKSGAVFGAKVNQKPASAWPNVQDILNKYGIKNTMKTGNITDPTTGEKGTKEIAKFKINPRGLAELNKELDLLRMPKLKRAKLMADILEQVFPKIVKQNKTEFTQEITLTMDPTGHFPETFNSEFMKLIAKTALSGYKLEQHKENFLFFNKTTRNYKVFRHEQMEDAIDNGTIELFGGIDWGDGQYGAAPKMYIP